MKYYNEVLVKRWRSAVSSSRTGSSLFRHRIIDSHSSCFYSRGALTPLSLSLSLSLLLPVPPVPPLRPPVPIFFSLPSPFYHSLVWSCLRTQANPRMAPFRSRSRLLRLAAHTEHIRVGRTRQVSNFRIRYKVSRDRAFPGNRSPGRSRSALPAA